jgi:outer membrane protein OmpA-like peptidoglycan-associated protein
VISTASGKKNRKIINNLARVNACSRVIPFDAYIDRPEFNSGALFTVRSSMNLVTTSDMKVVGLKADNIQFEFDQAGLQSAGVQELDEVGQFLQQNAGAYIALEAFTDNRGSKEYNQLLSRRRAHSVADYLKKYHRVNPNRVVMHWYGDVDPIASNDTAEGRAQNRRVEMAIGGVQ